MYVSGQQEITAAFKALELKVRKRIMVAALKKAGDPIAKAAMANVRPMSPTIAASIGIQMKSYRRGSFQSLKIGPTTDSLTWKTKTVESPFTGKMLRVIHKPSKTAHLVEGGTKPHVITFKNGRKLRHPGTSPRPWLRPARDEHAALAETTFISTAWKLIENEAKRHARKSARASKIDAAAAKILAAGGPE